uniref:IMS_C domain-containing protein n=1 Tax=Macrostomum lignano TaxID=282301 RepID=A0A1I8G6U0_9PLAT
ISASQSEPDLGGGCEVEQRESAGALPVAPGADLVWLAELPDLVADVAADLQQVRPDQVAVSVRLASFHARFSAPGSRWPPENSSATGHELEIRRSQEIGCCCWCCCCCCCCCCWLWSLPAAPRCARRLRAPTAATADGARASRLPPSCRCSIFSR